MNKKAQGLPLNTVVLAILVIVVLVLVLTFFFGGFTGLSMKIRQIFFGSLAGTSETLAIQNCEQYCSQLQYRSDPGVAGRKEMFDKSAFCKPVPVDLDEDGKAEIKASCKHFKVSCTFAGVMVNCEKETEPIS